MVINYLERQRVQLSQAAQPTDDVLTARVALALPPRTIRHGSNAVPDELFLLNPIGRQRQPFTH